MKWYGFNGMAFVLSVYFNMGSQQQTYPLLQVCCCGLII